jgi:hypothetical protein
MAQTGMDQRTWNLTVGFAGGLAAAAVLPFLRPVLSETLRPLAKELLKQSMRGWERVRTGVGIAAESLEDLLAEVRAELDAEAEGNAEAHEDDGDVHQGIAEVLPHARRTAAHEAVS